MIGKGTAVVRNYGCAANLIDVYILARDGEFGLQTASNDLKNALQAAIDDYKMMTDIVCIKDGEIIEVDVYVDVVLDKFYRKFEDEHRARVGGKLTAFFNLVRWEYGQDLTALDIVKDLSDIKEIKTMTINLLTDDPANSGDQVAARFYQIIRPQTYTINFVYV